MANPLYEVGSIVFIRESAALGFLESQVINGIVSTNGKWAYTVRGRYVTSTGTYGDRNSLVNAATLYLSEDELLTECQALALIEANLTRRLETIRQQRSALCADSDTTVGT